MVKDRFNTHCDMIALLCKPENELSAAIPSANPTKTMQGSEVRLYSYMMSRYCNVNLYLCAT